MNKYIDNLKVCIDQKLQEYAFNNGKSIIDTHILFEYHVTEISRIYRKPYEHYSKILATAYKKVIKNGL